MAAHDDTIDWLALHTGRAPRPPRAAVEDDILHPDVAVAPVAHKGLGVVARRALPAGALVMATRPLALARPGEPCPGGAASRHAWADGKGDRVLLLRRVVAAMGESEGARARVRALTRAGDASGAGAGDDPALPDDDVAAAVCEANAFCLTPEGYAYVAGGGDARPRHADGELVGCGLWVLPARLNHACAPNCRWGHVGGVMAVRTVRAVAAGEELTHSYVGVAGGLADGAARRARLREGYGFECDCALCAQERAVEAAVLGGGAAGVGVGAGGGGAAPPPAADAWRLEDAGDPDGPLGRALAQLPRPPPPQQLAAVVRLGVAAGVAAQRAMQQEGLAPLATAVAAVPVLVRAAHILSIAGSAGGGGGGALANAPRLAAGCFRAAVACAWREDARGAMLDEGVKAALALAGLVAAHPQLAAAAAAPSLPAGGAAAGPAPPSPLPTTPAGLVDAARAAFGWGHPPCLWRRMPLVAQLTGNLPELQGR